MKICMIFLVTCLKLSKSSDSFCAVKRDTLKNESVKLQELFNITDPSPKLSTCSDYQKLIYKIIEDVNDESFLSPQQSIEFKNLKIKYQNEWDHLETSFINNKEEMEEEHKRKMREIGVKIIETDRLIDNLLNDQQNSIENHKKMIQKFDKCGAEPVWNEFSTQTGTYDPKRRPNVPKVPAVMCKVTNKWFVDLKALIDFKVTSSFELEPTDDCDKKRKWLLKVNKIFSEAVKKVSQSFDIETYKIGFERLLEARRQEIENFYLQMLQEHQRRVKAEDKYLQTLNSELQKVRHHFERLLDKQNEDLEHLGLKLMGCELFDLALELVHEVQSEEFLKQVFTKQYENSTTEDRSESIMKLITHIKTDCGKFKAYLALYSIITYKSHLESPIIIEVIQNIRTLRSLLSNCNVVYDESKFSSQTIATDPIVENILTIWSDSIKVGSYTKILNFNYNYAETFEQTLPVLVEKSYTGNNLNYLLGFKDQLIWLSHKYIVLNKLLDVSPPKSDNDKKLFKESVDKTASEMSLYKEHDKYLAGLRNRMKEIGI